MVYKLSSDMLSKIGTMGCRYEAPGDQSVEAFGLFEIRSCDVIISYHFQKSNGSKPKSGRVQGRFAWQFSKIILS